VLLVTHDVDEAILLADRIVVLTDGRLSLDLRVDVPSPRWRGDPAFSALRSRLLAELGLDETAVGAPPRHTTIRQTPTTPTHRTRETVR
jgi:sulfonate transport system ATP-binding protein